MLQRMKSYLFFLCEDPDSKGTIHYSIDITPARGKNSRVAKKRYADQFSFLCDVESDFLYATPNGLRRREYARLSDERAKYYGWTEASTV
jgi:hypothetical protein